MLRNVLFQTHWLIGITFGVIMGVAGLTGSLISFDHEIIKVFSAPPTIAAPATPLLSPEQLVAKVQAAVPTRRLRTLTLSGVATEPATVQFVVERREPDRPVAVADMGAMPMQGMQGEGGAPGGGRPGQINFVNPYTGEILPQPGAAAEGFFRTTENIHRGMWAGRDTGIGTFVSGVMGYSALFLLIMIPTGLYLRWPRGIAAGKWRSWFAINFKLKGQAFLYSLHAVIGTFVLSVYLVSSHTGTMMNRQTEWYSNGVRTATGLPLRGEPGAGESGGGGRRQSPQFALNANLGAAWSAFQAAVPAYESATLAMATDGSPLLRVGYVPKGKTAADAAVLAFDANTGVAVTDVGGAIPSVAVESEGGGEGPPPNESFWTALIGGSQQVHTGRFFGAAGQLVMGFSGLMMPVLLISGYMMYLDRRRRKKERLAKATAN
jgi:sulfite reductase (NADPH) flavoprotein alpha-component